MDEVINEEIYQTKTYMQKYVYESRRNECGNKERKQSTKEKSEEIHE